MREGESAREGERGRGKEKTERERGRESELAAVDSGLANFSTARREGARSAIIRRRKEDKDQNMRDMLSSSVGEAGHRSFEHSRNESSSWSWPCFPPPMWL